MSDKLLEVKNLSVEYDTEISTVYAVNGLDLDLNYGETLGLVGETGAGKTTTALSVIQLLPEGIGFVTDGSIKLDGVDMLNAPEEKIRAMRGSVVSMIFQDPMSALNPVMTVGAQIMEVLKIHHPEQSTAQLEARVDEMMELVGIPAKRKVEYPHQFSGGMKQRIVIAIALACEPKLILADEPTGSLDSAAGSELCGLLRELCREKAHTVVMVTHEPSVALAAKHVLVLKDGAFAGEIADSLQAIEKRYKEINAALDAKMVKLVEAGAIEERVVAIFLAQESKIREIIQQEGKKVKSDLDDKLRNADILDMIRKESQTITWEI